MLVVAALSSAVTLWMERGFSAAAGGAGGAHVFAAFVAAAGPAKPASGRKRRKAPAVSRSVSRRHIVVTVIDGDTLVLDNGERVRLAGVDAPESTLCGKHSADLGRMAIGDVGGELQAMGARAAERARELALGRECRIEPAESRDRYGRVLAYVHLGDGRILNEVLLEEGYARVYSAPPRRRQRYLDLQESARAARRGLWRGY